MAKTTRKQGQVSKHSRAARRETSPSIDTDKSLKHAQPPDESKVLSVHHGAGITKRKSKAKRLSRTQRLRHEKGMARAEAVVDQMETKVAQSTKKAKTIKGRRTDWEDINKAAGDRARGRKKLDAYHENDEQEDTETPVMDDEEALKETAAMNDAQTIENKAVLEVEVEGASKGNEVEVW